MSLVNLTEVLYSVERLWGRAKAEEIDRLLEGFPVEFVPVDRELARSAAHFKANNTLALGDCYCAALAEQRQAAVYTGDPEFKQLEKQLKIVWLRQG
jgi:PIN domain nuclease of toxin-antitoxin system